MINLTTDTDCEADIPVSSDAEEPKIIINIAMGMVALFSICGILGNALAIFVFSRQKQKLSSTIFILTLAVTDFMSSLFTMPYTIIIELLEYRIQYDFLCKLYQFMKTTTIPFSAFVMVAIALDRYLCIVYPFKKAMTIQRAKITVVVLSVFAFALGILCSLLIGTYQVYQEKDKTCLVSDSDNMTYVVKSQNETEINSDGPKTGDIVYVGICQPTTIIFDHAFMVLYQKVYSCFFGICAVLVTVLYTLTYRSVLAQRRKMLHLSNKCCGFLTRSVSEENVEREEVLRPGSVKHTTNIRASPNISVNDENIKLMDQQEYRVRSETRDSHESNGLDQGGETRNTEKEKQIRPSGVSRAKLKKLRVANIKTALMLSIVAFIYIVAFTPAWMMALGVLRMNVIVYYLYFVYNVANPVIYAFLNQNFQNQLQALFKCGGCFGRDRRQSALAMTMASNVRQ